MVCLIYENNADGEGRDVVPGSHLCIKLTEIPRFQAFNFS